MSGRRKMGRIRTHPARQQRLAAKTTAAQAEHGRPVPATAALLEAVPKLPRSWLVSPWLHAGPFVLRKAEHRAERRAREAARRAAA